MDKEIKEKKEKAITIKADAELIKILDDLKKNLEDYLWNSAEISYRELTAILAKKINAKQIKI